MNKHGQSIIEYAVIVILVILGVVTMGPYLLRSINAHFKLWNDGVHDSFTENLQQSPFIPPLTGNCNCKPAALGCGTNSGGVNTCGVGYMQEGYNCNPLGCNGAAGPTTCVWDPTDCCAYVPEGCGSFPCPAGGCSGAPSSPPPSTDNCYYGQNIMVDDCASQPIECQPSPNCPLPACLGLISVSGASPCPNGPPVSSFLQNYYVSFVPDQSACNPAVPCQYSCPSGMTFENGICIVIPSCTVGSIPFTPNGTLTCSECGANENCTAGFCQCNSGYIYPGTGTDCVPPVIQCTVFQPFELGCAVYSSYCNTDYHYICASVDQCNSTCQSLGDIGGGILVTTASWINRAGHWQCYCVPPGTPYYTCQTDCSNKGGSHECCNGIMPASLPRCS